MEPLTKVKQLLRHYWHVNTIKGTDSRRELCASARRLLHRNNFLVRHHVARDCRHKAGFQIPAEQGFKIFKPGHFAEADDVVRAARSLISKTDPDNSIWSRPQVKPDCLNMGELTLESPYLRFAMRADILTSISAYLGVVPVLAYVGVWYSRDSHKKIEGSQLFHCDWDDITQVKIFVHCSDIDIASGPLVLLEANKSAAARASLNYKYGDRHCRVPDEKMEAVVGINDRHPIVGPVGTVAFVDSSRCFHYGSRVDGATRRRILAAFQFVTPSAFLLPLNYRKGAPFIHLGTGNMSTLERLVLGAE